MIVCTKALFTLISNLFLDEFEDAWLVHNDSSKSEHYGASEARVRRFSFDYCATTTHDKMMALNVSNRKLNSLLDTPRIIDVQCAVLEIFELASCRL